MVEIMNKPAAKPDVKQGKGFAPVPTRPVGFDMMRRLSEEWDRLWDDLAGSVFRNRWPGPLRRGSELDRSAMPLEAAEWSPRVEIVERECELLVRAELPGMSRDDVKVEVTDDLITIEGERKAETKEEKEGYFYSERSYGHFVRGIPLPEGADAEKARADFKDGILEVAIPIPARPAQQPRRIEIGGNS